MLKLYTSIMWFSEPLLNYLLQKRLKAGKEDAQRIDERKGQPSLPRPKTGKLLWVHGASVGEAQSALILIHALLQENEDLHILMTTGTQSSANLMADKLPPRAFHQFYPIDHPDWCATFLDYWKPDCVLWMESELWPNMLMQIKDKQIPAALLNARLSPKSFKTWKRLKGTAQRILSAFTYILCQTDTEMMNFQKLGIDHVATAGNLKHSAKALPSDDNALKILRGALQNRPCWVFASTHKGEEELAARVHGVLKSKIENLLTIIIPRHPERRETIQQDLQPYSLTTQLRGEDSKTPPDYDTDLYIADTFGELGLFYRLAPIACIGRSFSDDGGGGHNPIEAAQLGCAVLHGPHIQNLQDIFDDMDARGAAMMMDHEGMLIETLLRLFKNEDDLTLLQNKALQHAKERAHVLGNILKLLNPTLKHLDIKF